MYDINSTIKVNNLNEALKFISCNENITIVAGGTDVLIRMKGRKLKDAMLLSILDLDELKGIEVDDKNAIIIKAATCFSDIAVNSIINERIPMLAESVNQVGSPQIRNIATIGGNICNGAVSADSVPSLLALEALLELKSNSNTRVVPINDFFMGPGKTILKSDEILTRIIIPYESYNSCGSKYIKFGQRNAMEISTLGCAVNVKLDKNKSYIDKIRIAFGVAAPKPIRCYKLEEMLQGKEVGKDIFDIIQKNVLKELSPRDSWRASKELRIQLIKELSKRATKQAIYQAGGKYYD